MVVLAGIALTPSEVRRVAEASLDQKQLDELDRQLYPGSPSRRALVWMMCLGLAGLLGFCMVVVFAYSGLLEPSSPNLGLLPTPSTMGVIRSSTSSSGGETTTTRKGMAVEAVQGTVPSTTSVPPTTIVSTTLPEVDPEDLVTTVSHPRPKVCTTVDLLVTVTVCTRKP